MTRKELRAYWTPIAKEWCEQQNCTFDEIQIFPDIGPVESVRIKATSRNPIEHIVISGEVAVD